MKNKKKKKFKVIPEHLVLKIVKLSNSERTFNELRKLVPELSRSSVYKVMVENNLPFKPEKKLANAVERGQSESVRYFRHKTLRGSFGWL